MFKICKMNLKMFNSEKDFFTNAFEEAYNISDGTSDAIEDTQETSEVVEEQIPQEDIQEPINAPQESPELTPEQIKELYLKHFGEEENSEPEYDEEVQLALDLKNYLEQNSHLVQAMRELDAKGYKELNNFVPDEITRELNELKEFKAELQYREYIKDLQSKYSDFNEEEVLEYAGKVDVVDLEVAYKAMKADKMQEPNIEELREQIKKELLEELKQNSINTQTLVGSTSQKPINQNDTVTLSSKEQRIAKAMGLTPSEYAKWR